MKRISLAVLAFSCALAIPLTSAQSIQPLRLAQAAAARGASVLSDAEVRKIDKEAGKITLKHGEIKNLDMPPMTMVFQVKDKSLLDKLKAGDKVRFAADKVGGALTITEMEFAK